MTGSRATSFTKTPNMPNGSWRWNLHLCERQTDYTTEGVRLFNADAVKVKIISCTRLTQGFCALLSDETRQPVFLLGTLMQHTSPKNRVEIIPFTAIIMYSFSFSNKCCMWNMSLAWCEPTTHLWWPFSQTHRMSVGLCLTFTGAHRASKSNVTVMTWFHSV